MFKLTTQITLPALVLAGAAFAAPAFSAESTTLGDEIDEALLELKVKAQLLETIGWDMLDVDVEATADRIVLEGEADGRAHQELAEEAAKAVDGVASVDNRIVLEDAASSTSTPVGDAVANAENEVRDAILESRVKSALIAEMGRHAFSLEVEAADGSVSLRGEVPSGEFERIALSTARECEGVDEVKDLIETA